MFGRSKKPDTGPFMHALDCKIVKADPGVQIEWQEIEHDYWKRECVCTVEHRPPQVADGRTRQDPLDPALARHGAVCEHRDTTDPALLRALLKVTPADGYSVVECGACSYLWNVADFGGPPTSAPRRGRTSEEILGPIRS